MAFVDSTIPFLAARIKGAFMTNPVGLVLLAAKIKRRPRDLEILALCEGAEKHLANRMANNTTVANSVANMANKPTAPELDRSDYMRG
jgi:hypothetical protein